MLLVNGRSFADSVSVAPSANGKLWPVALTEADALPQETATLLDALNPLRMYVVGGRAAVSDAVVEQAVAAACRYQQDANCVKVARISGADRFETAAAFATYLVTERPGPVTTVNLARGDIFPDALAAGVYGGRLDPDGVTLLVTPDELPEATAAWLHANREAIDTVNVLGSADAVSDEVWQQARDLAE